MAQMTYLTRLREAPRYYLSGLYREISTKNVFLFAQAIAFKVLVTIVPIMILATGILGRVLRGENAFEQVANFIEEFLPPSESRNLIAFLYEFTMASGTLTLIGAVGLALTAMTLVTTVRVAVSGAFEQDWNVQRSILSGYLFDLRMVGQVGLFFILTVGLTVAVQMLSAEGSLLLRQLGIDYMWLHEGWRGTFRMVGLVLPFLITTLMFFQLFYFIPTPHPPRRSALIGAFVTALLWEMAKFGFTFYVNYVGQFDRYRSVGPQDGSGIEDGMAALGSTFGLLIAFVFWVYYSGIVLMIGAIIASLHEQHRRVRRREAEQEALRAREAARGVDKLDAAAHERPVQNTPVRQS